MRNFIKTLQSAAVLFVIGSGVTACGSDSTGPALKKDVMWQRSVFPRAISLAVGQTQPITVTALDYDGNVITKDVKVTYTSWDTTRVTVDSNGVVTGVANTNGEGVQIDVAIRAGVVERTDAVYVGVTETPVDIDSLTLQPAQGDPIMRAGDNGQIRTRAFDSQGNEIPGVFSLVEPAVNSFFGLLIMPGTGFATAGGTGPVMVYATLFVNGKLFTDSLEYQIRYRNTVDVAIRLSNGVLQTRFATRYFDNVFVAENSRVEFVNNLTIPVDVTFEQPDAVKADDGVSPGGNIVALEPRKRVARRLTTAGDYFFTVKADSNTKRSSITVKKDE